METILEVIHTNADGSEVKAILKQLPIRHYMGIIKFNSTDNLANAEFKNMERYGWMGTVQPNYQAMESSLRSAIAKNLGAGKAKCIVLFAHGAEISTGGVTSSYFRTNHLSATFLSGLHLHFQTRLTEGIPAERAANVLEYKKEKEKLDADLEREELNKENNDSLEKERDYKEVRKDEKKIERVDAQIKQLEEDYNKKEEDLQDDEKHIKKNFCNAQAIADIQSLGNIIGMIEDGGSLVFASCYSGHGLGYSAKVVTYPLLTEIIKYYKPAINIFGVEKNAIFSSNEGSSGVFDGEVIIEKDGGMLIAKKGELNCVVKVTPSGEVSKHTNIKIVKANINIL